MVKDFKEDTPRDESTQLYLSLLCSWAENRCAHLSLPLSLLPPLPLPLAHTHTRTLSQIKRGVQKSKNTHTLAGSLSLSLSLSNTHTHTIPLKSMRGFRWMETHTHAGSLSLSHTHTHYLSQINRGFRRKETHTNTLARARDLFLSLSLSLSHTHTHTMSLRSWEGFRRMVGTLWSIENMSQVWLCHVCVAARCSVCCSALQYVLHCRRCDCVMCVLQRVAVCVALSQVWLCHVCVAVCVAVCCILSRYASVWYVTHRPSNSRSLLQKTPITETILCNGNTHTSISLADKAHTLHSEASLMCAPLHSDDIANVRHC